MIIKSKFYGGLSREDMLSMAKEKISRISVPTMFDGRYVEISFKSLEWLTLPELEGAERYEGKYDVTIIDDSLYVDPEGW